MLLQNILHISKALYNYKLNLLFRELKRKREGKKRKVETLDLVEEDDDEIR